MAQVRLTVSRVNRVDGNKELQNAGDIITVSADEARRLIEADQAVNVQTPSKTPAKRTRSRKKA